MSFQKAHNVSNELAEVVVTSDEIDLNTTAVTSLPVQPLYKNYRVLEVGFVVIQNSVETTSLQVLFGTPSNDDGIVDTTTALTIPANSFGTTFSTSTGAFAFQNISDPDGEVTQVDADGVPRISAGDRIIFEVDAGAGQPTRACVFARLAPSIEYKD